MSESVTTIPAVGLGLHESPPGDDAHHAGHNPHLAHHFENMEQQHSAAKLGMWLFLVTEILLFGGLFVAYTVFRALHPEVFQDASKYLNVYLGTINTMVLIGSSLTMALGVRAAQLSKNRQLIVFMVITIVLAFTFLVIKYFEYMHKFHMGLYPGEWFNPGEEAAGMNPRERTFFSIYFLMTGLHGIHVLLGIGLISWLVLRASRHDFNAVYYTPVELAGLYWHLVDIIWIFLFPLFYLIR